VEMGTSHTQVNLQNYYKVYFHWAVVLYFYIYIIIHLQQPCFYLDQLLGSHRAGQEQASLSKRWIRLRDYFGV
jgi:hypothetical protein